MRVLLIADIHGNYRALEAVLNRFGDADEIWCMGDLVSCGPMSPECLETARKVCRHIVRGNHDNAPSVPNEPRVDVAYLDTLPERLAVRHEGTTYLLVHNLPGHTGYVKVEQGLAPFRNAAGLFDEEVCLFGHSHTPLIVEAGGKRFVNVGTVGQARDGIPQAQCMILENGQFTFHRVPYDLEALEADFRRTKVWEGPALETWIGWTKHAFIHVHGLQLGPFSVPPKQFE